MSARNGQAYSLITLLIAVPLFLIITVSLTTFQRQQSGVAEGVFIDQMRIVERTIEDDFRKGAEISAKRAFIAATDSVVTNGTYLDSAVGRVAELMFYGTISGAPVALMENNTLLDWQHKILNISTGFTASISYASPTLSNVSGALVYGSLDIIVTVDDQFQKAHYQKQVTKPIVISLEGFDDPFIVVASNGLLKRTYKISPYPYYAKKLVVGSASGGNCSGPVTFNGGTPDAAKILVTADGTGIGGFAGVLSEGAGAPGTSCFVTGAAGAVASVNQTITETGYQNLTLDNRTNAAWHLPIADAILNKRYRTGVGPTVLERLQGNVTGSNYTNITGLESFVSIPDLQQIGIPVKANQSIVDFAYFATIPIAGRHLRPLPSWVLINNEFASYHNFSELLD